MLTFRTVLVVLLIPLLVGCEKEPQTIYGINPATMQCQQWIDDDGPGGAPGKFVGGFLSREEFCPGEPTPLVLPE